MLGKPACDGFNPKPDLLLAEADIFSRVSPFGDGVAGLEREGNGVLGTEAEGATKGRGVFGRGAEGRSGPDVFAGPDQGTDAAGRDVFGENVGGSLPDCCLIGDNAPDCP